MPSAHFFCVLAESISLLICLPEIQKSFGSDAVVGGIKFQFATRRKADVKLINDTKAAGIDCKDITIEDVAKEGREATVRCFCSAFLASTIRFAYVICNRSITLMFLNLVVGSDLNLTKSNSSSRIAIA
jgi:hypothetical protein